MNDYQHDLIVRKLEHLSTAIRETGREITEQLENIDVSLGLMNDNLERIIELMSADVTGVEKSAQG